MTDQPIMTNPQRALQVWSLLALAALTRTVLTYEEVAKLTGLPNECARVLGHVYYYCAKYKLPLLSVLVVSKDTGKPSGDLYDNVHVPGEQRRCFEHNWLNQQVPSLKELTDAYDARKATV